MLEKEGIVIRTYDSQGLEPDGNQVASISFVVESQPDISFCVGFRYFGGKMTDPDSWEYDHTAMWVGDDNEDRLVEFSLVESILEQRGFSVEKLLTEFCEMMGTDTSNISLPRVLG